MKSSDTRGVPHSGNKIHIPLTEREAIRLLGKVKPTADMLIGGWCVVTGACLIRVALRR